MLNISEVLDRSAEKWPAKPFIIFGDSQINYSDFRERVLGWTSYLKGKGIEQGDIIAVLSKNRLEMLELWMAACRMGAIFSPYNFNLKINEVRDLVSHSNPALLFSDQTLHEMGTEAIEFDKIRIEGRDDFICETAPKLIHFLTDKRGSFRTCESPI